VSGGSFTAAYYALRRGQIFDPGSDFQKRFLRANPERELFGEAVYYPQNWLRLLSRPEIAAHLWSKLLFGSATYGDLSSGTRPFIILNSSDYLSQHRFQFTQDRFDWICDDLDRFPLSRAVAASSAFPGLLNSLTLNTFNGSRCPVDRAEPQWVGNAMLQVNQFEDRPSYREALSYRAFSDSHEKYLHLLDGGLTDNLGLREIYEGLRGAAGASVPLLAMSNSGLIRNALIIVVNARPGDSPGKLYQPSAVPMGPITIPVIGATSSLPMGTVSYDSVDMVDELRDLWQQAREKQPHFMNVYAVELTFENIPDPAEREFFRSLPTDFALPGPTVDCLAVEGRHLLQAAKPYGGASPVAGAVPPAFADYVRDVLRGFMPPDTQRVVVNDGKCSVQ
jgi:NTE family protein